MATVKDPIDRDITCDLYVIQSTEPAVAGQQIGEQTALLLEMLDGVAQRDRKYIVIVPGLLLQLEVLRSILVGAGYLDHADFDSEAAAEYMAGLDGLESESIRIPDYTLRRIT